MSTSEHPGSPTAPRLHYDTSSLHAALVLRFSIVASGQIKLRRIDGWKKIAAVLSHHAEAA